MNERIRELLLQSGFKIFKDTVVAGDFGSSGNATVCAQKFAELIVRDCANWLADNNGHDGPSPSQLLEYFGVKE